MVPATITKKPKCAINICVSNVVSMYLRLNKIYRVEMGAGTGTEKGYSAPLKDFLKNKNHA